MCSVPCALNSEGCGAGAACSAGEASTVPSEVNPQVHGAREIQGRGVIGAGEASKVPSKANPQVPGAGEVQRLSNVAKGHGVIGAGEAPHVPRAGQPSKVKHGSEVIGAGEAPQVSGEGAHGEEAASSEVAMESALAREDRKIPRLTLGDPESIASMMNTARQNSPVHTSAEEAKQQTGMRGKKRKSGDADGAGANTKGANGAGATKDADGQTAKDADGEAERCLVEAAEWNLRYPWVKEMMPKDAAPPLDGKHGEFSYTKKILAPGMGTATVTIEVHVQKKAFRIAQPPGVVKPQLSWGDDIKKAWKDTLDICFFLN